MDLKQWIRKHPDRAGAWVAVALGAIALFLGWQGASTTEYPAAQLPYIVSGGIGGALVVVFGATLLISADLRDEWHKLDRIERWLQEAALNGSQRPEPIPPPPVTTVVDERGPDAARPTGGTDERRPRRVLTARRTDS
jgi:hypothetical protein